MKTPTIAPNYFRIKDAATYCSCSAEHLARCSRKRELDTIRKGRCVFFSIKALDAWMARDNKAAA